MASIVSVIIPYFNRQRTIRRAIDSVLQQTMQEFEIIVVDDASTDNVVAALEPYANNPKVQLIRLTLNRGPGAARNTGVAAAKSRFIAFLDSDDFWLPEKLSRQYAAVLVAPDPEMVICLSKTRILLNGGREIVRPVRAPTPGKDFAEFLYLENGFVQTSAFFLGRSLAQRFPFHEDMSQLEDHLFFIEIGAAAAQMILVDEVLTVWHNESIEDRASTADDLQRWIAIVDRFSERAAAYVKPDVLLAAEVRFLSGRLWKKSPTRSLRLMTRALRAGSLSPAQFAALFGKNILPNGIYDLARHWLAKRAAGAAQRVDKSDSLPFTFIDPNNKSILFVTEEPFLPPHNGSQQTYASVVRSYADDGWKVYCISFYRDPVVASSPAIVQVYESTFDGYLLLPGWNCGGKIIGWLGQAVREANRALTGNVLPSHPFLTTKSRAEAERVAQIVRSWCVGTIYVHKVHGLQLLGKALDLLADIPIVLNLHDDFVVRAKNYEIVHTRLFSALPLSAVIRNHSAAWLRHHLGRSNQIQSRRVEQQLLEKSQKILINSTEEMRTYQANPRLADKLVYTPAIYIPSTTNGGRSTSPKFHAGFIGSSDVMNLDALIYFRDQILPLIKADFPDFSFLIAGRIGPLARDLFEGAEGVTTWLSLARIEDFYDSVRVAVIPVCYGTGVSIRFIESMKFGIPIVSTTVGVRGHDFRPTPTVVTTDDLSEFARSVVAFARAGVCCIDHDVLA